MEPVRKGELPEISLPLLGMKALESAGLRITMDSDKRLIQIER